jgi:hypothetical protein
MLLLFQARFAGTILLCRLGSPMLQPDHVLGLYPESTCQSFRKNPYFLSVFLNTKRSRATGFADLGHKPNKSRR